jgi:hypothetical protein
LASPGHDEKEQWRRHKRRHFSFARITNQHCQSALSCGFALAHLLGAIIAAEARLSAARVAAGHAGLVRAIDLALLGLRERNIAREYRAKGECSDQNQNALHEPSVGLRLNPGNQFIRW